MKDKIMEKILYIDCFSGISGDMMAGALLDMGYKGLDIGFFKAALSGLDLKGYSISADKVKCGPVMATRFNVAVQHQQPSRNYSQIRNLILTSNLLPEVKKTAISMFEIIAAAEAKVHGVDADKVHFHEVGAVDSIIDITCVSLAINMLSPSAIFCRKIPLGSGTANTMHGAIPVPAPATLEIVKGLPVYGGGFGFEVTTPTGAAIVKALAASFDDIPEMIVEYSGNGAGAALNINNNLAEVAHMHGHSHGHGQGTGSNDRIIKSSPPDMLRLIFGTSPLKNIHDSVLYISTNIDDSTPEITGYLQDKLLSLGVLDCWTEPVFMKKNRAALKLCVLCNREGLDAIMDNIFKETSTLGIRVQEISRYCLEREIKNVKLPYGEADVKIGYFKGKQVIISPEYESCKSLAEMTGKPLKEIYRDLILFLSSK
jgi:uncharacterized protein (TIGR00299 family) protein